MLKIIISNEEFEINIEAIKYEDFLMKVNYNFNKDELINYDRDPDIFKKYILHIAYQNYIHLDGIKLDNISYIIDELNFLDYQISLYQILKIHI